MESGVQAVTAIHSQVVSTSVMARPIMSPSRLAKLPPISSGAAGEEEQHHPSSVFLEATTSELKETMQHLLCEVRTRSIFAIFNYTYTHYTVHCLHS